MTSWMRGIFSRLEPPLSQKHFGGATGGPIRKDKLFFFAAHEGTRIRQGVTRVSRVPTAAQLDGDLSSPAQLYDPLSSVPDPDRPGQRIRCR